MSEIKLTSEQISKIKSDMNEKVEMLNDAEINALAQKVNKAINLPFLNEEKEFVVFAKVIKWVDKQLYQLLPNEYYELVKDASDGISKEEAIKIEERLTPLINNVVNVPVLTEKQEEKLISLILGLIINAMVKGLKLEQVEPEN
ncbi:MAG: hypothetical protein P8P29_06505 [Flavobacteriaceae bacterium]|nr:hypothetical protein [Flavobacteriaceae bacterium]